LKHRVLFVNDVCGVCVFEGGACWLDDQREGGGGVDAPGCATPTVTVSNIGCWDLLCRVWISGLGGGGG
jgi:hypothetical protein